MEVWAVVEGAIDPEVVEEVTEAFVVNPEKASIRIFSDLCAWHSNVTTRMMSGVVMDKRSDQIGSALTKEMEAKDK